MHIVELVAGGSHNEAQRTEDSILGFKRQRIISSMILVKSMQDYPPLIHYVLICPDIGSENLFYNIHPILGINHAIAVIMTIM